MLEDSDVVMMIGARLNWLLSHGKGKSWGEPRSKKFIQIDIEPREMDSNVEIAAPVVGDIGSCVAALLDGMGDKWPPPPADWVGAVSAQEGREHRQDGAAADERTRPRWTITARWACCATIIKERPDAILVNEGANTLDLARGVIDMYQPRKRLDVGTWGVMGIGMGYAIAAAVETGKPVLAIEGDSAFGFSGMEVETICRYNLPVCIVVFNNDGIYRGTDVNPTAAPTPATTVFVKGARYDKMIEAFGGVGVNATTPDELKRAVNAAMDSGKPTLINAVIDPGRRQRERPHRQSQSAKRLLKKEVSGATSDGQEGESQGESQDQGAGQESRTPRASATEVEDGCEEGREEATAKKPAAKTAKLAAKKAAAKKVAPKKLPRTTASPGCRSCRRSRGAGRQGARRRQDPRLHPRPVGPDLHAAAGLVRRRRDQGRASGRGRHHPRPAARRAGRGQPLFHHAEPQQALDHDRLQARRARTCSSAW